MNASERAIRIQFRETGLTPNVATLQTRGDIVRTREHISVALSILTQFDSDLVDMLAALPPEEREE